MSKRRRVLFSGVWTVFVLLATLCVVVLNVPLASGNVTIYIRADGSIDPLDAPISTFDNVTYTLTGNITSDADGIVVERSYIIIDGNGSTVEGSGSGCGFNLTGITNVTIQNINIKNFGYGIYLSYSSNNSISENNMTGNQVAGICLAFSSDNCINGNAFVTDGLFVLESSYGNVVVDNFVNGKPLVYLEGVSSYTVEDAGQVILVNCTNILVENLNLSNTDKGVELWETTNTTIAGNNIADGQGIYLSYSSNNSIVGNNVASNMGDGIHLHVSSNNTISGNIATDNECGINLYSSSNNSISGNDLANIRWGVRLLYSSNNTIGGNNLTNNECGIDLYSSSNNNSISGNNITANSDYDILLNYSSSNIISGNNVADGGGIYLSYSSDNSISGNSITEIRGDGAHLHVSSNNSISGNNVANNGAGIDLAGSSNNTISGNNVVNNDIGIHLYGSSNNSISGNNVTANYLAGIFLNTSSLNNSISGNNMIRNRHGVLLMSSSNNIIAGNVFTGDGLVVLQSYGILAENNLVNGKPLVYLEGVSNHVVEDAGQVILVNCNNIRIENLNLSNTDYAIQLGGTNNTIITRNNIKANSNYGILFYDSSNNNSIIGNNIANNGYGMWLETFSNNNSIVGNNITNNSHGIFLGGCSLNNRIFHNNFMNNTQQAVSLGDGTVSSWDDGYPSGGNYWSDYNGTDLLKGPYQNLTGSDGVGDVPYKIPIVNSTGQTIGFEYANYSLMAAISIFDAGTWNGVSYDVNVVSNSTVSNFRFNPEEGAFITFNVTGEEGTSGFCRVAIPKSLLWVEDGWTITVGDRPIADYTIILDENYIYIYFAYNHSTQTVIIQGTHVIPEFPSSLILPLFIITTLLAAIFCRRKQKSKLKTI